MHPVAPAPALDTLLTSDLVQSWAALDLTVLHAAFAAARMGIWECSLPDETLRWTAGVYDLFDLPKDLPPSRAAALDLYCPRSRAELAARRSRAIAEGTGFEMDAEIMTPAGNHRWIRITATVQSRDGVPVRLFGIKRDITEERRLFEAIRYLSEHDPLTKLANRGAFQAALGALAAGSPDGADTALLLIDLDGFKAINDALGHAAGDDVLKCVAEVIRAYCAPADLAARIGGDEFAVLVRSDGPRTGTMAAAIVGGVNAVPVAGYRIGASIGIAAWRDHATADGLFQAADAALYAAKASGRGTFRFALPGR